MAHSLRTILSTIKHKDCNTKVEMKVCRPSHVHSTSCKHCKQPGKTVILQVRTIWHPRALHNFSSHSPTNLLKNKQAAPTNLQYLKPQP